MGISADIISATMQPGKLFIGTSGWHYRHWAGPFYPNGIATQKFLEFYAEHFPTVEINSTFYRLPTSETLTNWRDRTPPDFVFACKASRYVTHMKKLKDPRESINRFLEVVNVLGGKLGPILFQLPPRWHARPQRLAAFLEAFPEGYRYAFEFRDETWFTEETFGLLSRHNVAFCIYDLDRKRVPDRLTSDFVYARLHGPDRPYRGRYGKRGLRAWALKICRWRNTGRDVYCYFDNDENGYAAQDASCLTQLALNS